jgi:methionyl-tRNA formyltransferase
MSEASKHDGLIVFMGTPAYAVPALGVVAASAHPVLVITQPDRPAGRGRQLRPSAVKEAARTLGLPVLTPSRLGPKTFARLRELSPKLIVTAAYGGILPPAYLALPPAGAYNLHASLLPRWRGPNPIAWAIRAGDAQTGVTLMRMDEGVDTGPIVVQRALPIGGAETTGSLTGRLADLAGALLDEWLCRLLGGDGVGSPQGNGYREAPKFESEASRIDWSQPAASVSAQIRSLLPDPGPWALAEGERLVIREVAGLLDDEGGQRLRPGQIERRGDEWRIGCGQGRLRVTLIQPAGRRAMSPGAYVRGLRHEVRALD